MKSDIWVRPLDAAGTWLCEHVDQAGNPGPPTQLSLAEAEAENSDATSLPGRARLQCPDCGTYWRVWEQLRISKYYVASPHPQSVGVPGFDRPRYCRSQTLDIDHVVAAVANVLPNLRVSQWQQVWPGDDDGLWWLSLPETHDIQIESTTGMCPFVIETEEQCCANARTANTVSEAVSIIVEYLSSPKQEDIEPDS